MVGISVSLVVYVNVWFLVAYLFMEGGLGGGLCTDQMIQ